MGLLSYLPGGKKFEKYTGAPSFGKIASKIAKDTGYNGHNNASAYQPTRSLQDVLLGFFLGLGIGQTLGHAQSQLHGCCNLYGGFQQQQPSVNIYNFGGSPHGGSFTYASHSSSVGRYLGC